MTGSIPIALERDNVNDETVTLARWFAAHGDKVELDALLAEVETSKANIEIHAPKAGYLVQEFPQGAEIPVTAIIGYIAAEAPAHAVVRFTKPTAAPSVNGPVIPQAAQPSAPVAAVAAPSPPIGSSGHAATVPDFPPASEYRQRYSPVAAKMMETHTIPISAFAGKSVVRKQDILYYLNPPPGSSPAPAPASQLQRYPLARIAQPYREMPLSKRKRSEAANLGAGMGNALASSVSVTCFTRGLRDILKATLGGSNPSGVFVFEVSRLLRKYPGLNAAYREGSMLQYENVNIGFAMDDGRGLKVAVLPDCDQLSLSDILAVLHELSIAYVEDKLKPTQIANPTFTISDLSGLGVSSFLPLISDGQGAILGVGGEQFAPGTPYGFYSLTLTFDHQLSDGRTAGLFLNDLKERLAHYEAMAPEVRSELVCSRCYRTAAELRGLDAHLIQMAGAEGNLCSLCTAGW
ncbi:MAG TPA: 2-oxo acid dehydrogenase subunit E2 [Acidobacteriaceae bacterium]|nr:2-oxo acid dehydrogenase subunit E2 [Acidobacteriaceae bacterium]